MEESVLVIPSAKLEEECGHIEGWDDGPIQSGGFDRLIASHGFFIMRSMAEVNPEFKQVIPYCVVHCGDEVLCYRRGSGSGESRLHGNLSIGFGGHVSVDEDFRPISSVQSSVNRALVRELNEELTIVYDKQRSIRRYCLLNHDEDAVGKVHLGVLYSFDAGSKAVRSRNLADESDLRWLSFSHLLEKFDEFERWSQIAIEVMITGYFNARNGK